MNPVIQTARFPTAVISTNKVLKNAYLLLALSLGVAAISAYFSIGAGARPVHWLLMMLVFVGGPFAIAAVRNSVWALPATFLYTGVTGWFLGPFIGFYLTRVPGGEAVVFNALATTAIVFLGMTAYALVSKRDFSFMRGFLFAGLLVALIAIVANIFLAIPALSMAISAACVLLMSALILYRTSEAVNGGETNYVMLTVDLYSSIYVLFTHLLNLLGFAGDD
jgi:modulator of FtsH protease